ncbi:MAG: hypothetical protein RI890_1403, partial [Actinomycetota bacterium]
MSQETFGADESDSRVIDEHVPAALDGQRVDRIVSLVADIPRASAAALIEAGAVLLDGAVVKAGKIKATEGQQAMEAYSHCAQEHASHCLHIVCFIHHLQAAYTGGG